MFTFTVEMDLSSLEGPPIQDSRFSAPSWGGSVPHIQLDTSVLSPSRSDGEYEGYWDRDVSPLPPRPASTEPVSSPRTHRYSAIENSSFRRSEIQPLNVGNSGWGFTGNTDVSVPSSRPRSSHTSRPHQEQSFLSTQDPSSPSSRRHPNRLQSQSVSSSSHQLVWLDSEQIWVLTTPRPSPSPSDFAPPRPNLPPLATTMHSRPPSTYIPPPQQTHPTNLAHSRSMETFFGNNEVMSPNYDDLPPPYERHIYDQQLATGAGVSRWTAVARRVNQSPF